jgi:hypothetical protein
MKNSILLVGLTFILACNNNSAGKPEQASTDSLGMISPSVPVDSLMSPANTIENNIEADSMEAIDANPDIETLYVLVADTGKQYITLNTTMYTLARKTDLEVDTLGRYYNSQKNKIVLSEEDDDELYAGEYFPRRFPSTSLSMEYMDTYNSNASEGMMGIIAGIFQKEEEAVAALKKIQALQANAHVIKAAIYVGCIH